MNLLNFGITKRNILKLISSPSKAETVAKSLNNVERFEFNKTFPAFEKLFLKTYGFNNRNVNESDITTYIKAFLLDPTSLNNKAEPAQKNINKTSSKEAVKQLVDLAIEKGIFRRAPANVNQIGTIIKLYHLDPPIDISDSKYKNIYDGLETKVINQFQAFKNLNEAVSAGDEYKDPLSQDEVTARYEDFKRADKAHDDEFEQYEKLKRANELYEASKMQPIVEEGSGIHAKQDLALIRFGKIHISPKKLYYNNVLSIKNAKKKSITGIPEKKISDNLSNVVMKIVEGGTITKADLHTLNQTDRHIYNNLIKLGGLHKDNENSFEDTAKHMAERLKLVEGEINAGNDEQDLLKEAHQLLHGLSNCKVISGRAAAQHYKHLQQFFK